MREASASTRGGLFVAPSRDTKMSQKTSDSTPQLEAEVEMLELYAQKENLRDFGPKKMIFDGCSVEIDGYSREAEIACEIFAHIGELKPGQVRKIALDALKLIYLERKLGKKIKKILIFADNDICKYLQVGGGIPTKKWLANCLEEFGIETWVAPLKESTKKRIKEQQLLQRRQC